MNNYGNGNYGNSNYGYGNNNQGNNNMGNNMGNNNAPTLAELRMAYNELQNVLMSNNFDPMMKPKLLNDMNDIAGLIEMATRINPNTAAGYGNNIQGNNMGNQSFNRNNNMNNQGFNRNANAGGGSVFGNSHAKFGNSAQNAIPNRGNNMKATSSSNLNSYLNSINADKVQEEIKNTPPVATICVPAYPYVLLKGMSESIENGIRVLYGDGSAKGSVPIVDEGDDVYLCNPLLFKNNRYIIASTSLTLLPASIVSTEMLDVRFTSFDVESCCEVLKEYLDGMLIRKINNFLDAIEFGYSIETLEDIQEVLTVNDVHKSKLKRLKNILNNMYFKKYVSDVEGEEDKYVELNLNDGRVYADDDYTLIPDTGDKFFLTSDSNEYLYDMLMGEAENSDFGVLERLQDKFEYYIGTDKILLVRL